MKILTIGATYGGGGPGGTAQFVHQFLIENGVQSKVVCALTNYHDENIRVIYKPFEMVLFRICKNVSQKGGKLLSRFITRRIKKVIDEFQPDIIHIRVIHHNYFSYKSLFEYLANYQAPVVFSFHDLWLMTGGCYHFIDIGCNQYMSGCSDCPKPARLLDCRPKEVLDEWRTKKELIGNIKTIATISVSKWVQECVEKSYFANFTNVLIYNSVDLNIFYPRSVKKGEKYIVVGSANMWSEAKGLNDFVKLAELLPDNYEIHLIGNIPKGTTLSSNIKCLGHISSKDEIARLYSEADVFVHLSIHETFGLVIAEAACCGKITVGYDISAIPEILHLAKGVPVPAKDVQAVRNEIIRICSSSETLNGEDLERVRGVFSKKRLVKEHLDLYESLCNRG